MKWAWWERTLAYSTVFLCGGAIGATDGGPWWSWVAAALITLTASWCCGALARDA